MQMLVFELQNEVLGIDIKQVREILTPGVIHPVHHAPDFIRGVMTLREHVIAVLNIHQKLRIPEQEKKDEKKKRIVICVVHEHIFGMMVDGVRTILQLEESNINATPKIMSARPEENYVSGIARVGEEVITILDMEKILAREDAEKLSGTEI
jgi:purine-binding chemotaxis protein CheW